MIYFLLFYEQYIHVFVYYVLWKGRNSASITANYFPNCNIVAWGLKKSIQLIIGCIFEYFVRGPGFVSHSGWHYRISLLSDKWTAKPNLVTLFIVTCNIRCLFSQINLCIISRCPPVPRQHNLEFPDLDGDVRLEGGHRVRRVLPADEPRGRSPDRLLHGHVQGRDSLHRGQGGSQGNLGMLSASSFLASQLVLFILYLPNVRSWFDIHSWVKLYSWFNVHSIPDLMFILNLMFNLNFKI